MAIVVCAKYEDRERVSLWDDIYSLCHTIRVSWMAGGYFNVIMNEDKIGGLPVYPNKYVDFVLCLNSCELFDVKFKGSPFT